MLKGPYIWMLHSDSYSEEMDDLSIALQRLDSMQ